MLLYVFHGSVKNILMYDFQLVILHLWYEVESVLSVLMLGYVGLIHSHSLYSIQYQHFDA